MCDFNIVYKNGDIFFVPISLAALEHVEKIVDKTALRFGRSVVAEVPAEIHWWKAQAEKAGLVVS